MEYLTIAGRVRLKPSIDEGQLAVLIERFNLIKFERSGSVSIDREADVLAINVEGEVADEAGLDTICLLRTLSLYSSDGSNVVISRIRWEINVTLSYQDKPFMPLDVFSFLNTQERNVLILL